MFEGSRGSDLTDIPSAVAQPKRRSSPQLIWLVPIVAVLIGGWLAVKTILEKGPTVTITFKTAEGLEAGKTKVKYKNVDVGEVRTIALSEDHSEIIATVEFEKQAEHFSGRRYSILGRAGARRRRPNLRARDTLFRRLHWTGHRTFVDQKE